MEKRPTIWIVVLCRQADWMELLCWATKSGNVSAHTLAAPHSLTTLVRLPFWDVWTVSTGSEFYMVTMHTTVCTTDPYSI